jgi:Zinc knuckle
MGDNDRPDFHRAHAGGLDFNEAPPGATGPQRLTASANGWFVDAPETPSAARIYKPYLSDLATRFVNQFDGYKPARVVTQWFEKAEQLLTEKAVITKLTFGYMPQALASHYGVALIQHLFTEDVPARINTANNPLKETVAEYDQSITNFRQMRQRYVVPFARQILYTMVAPHKRAEVAQALTTARQGVNKEGDVVDYIALKDVLSSKAFTQIETLEEAVFKNGMPKAFAAGSGALKGVTRTIIMAMKQESTAMYNYMNEEFAARVRAAGNIDTALYTGRDLMAIADKLILGHHLGATLTPSVLESLRQKNLVVVADANGVEKIVLEVPQNDSEGILGRLDAPLRKAWRSIYADSLPTKKSDGPVKRKKAAASAEATPTAIVADTAAAEASGTRSTPGHQEKRSKNRHARFSDTKKTTQSATSSSSSKVDAAQATIGSAQPPRHRPPTGHSAGSSSRNVGASNSSQEQRDMTNVQCYNCAEMGHYAPNCAKPRTKCEQCKKSHQVGPCIANRLKPRK